MRSAIAQARTSGDLAKAHSLIMEQSKLEGGKVSAHLAYEWGLVLMADKKYGEARDVFLLFSAAYPENASAWFLVGQCSEIMGEYEVARHAFHQSVRVHKAVGGQKDLARSYFSLGANLFRLGRNAEGEDAWRKGLRGTCESSEAVFVRSQVRLALGDYSEGAWKDYEARRLLPGWMVGVSARGYVSRVGMIEWDGESMGSVLVYGEQGAGDTAMFSRYIAQVEFRTLAVAGVLPGKDLSRLMWRPPVPARFSVPICSLPRVLGMLEPIPPATQNWKKPANTRPRVGVCWRGAKDHLNDQDRSSPIDFRDALRDERWDIVSLQYGEDFKPKDYLETAELMKTLDAVLTVDTSVVHVAGTLGVPTVCIVPASPEWRWGLAEGKSVWYPSVDMIRRKRVDAWPEAIERAHKTLAEIVRRG